MTTQESLQEQAPARHAALERLDALVGEWEIKVFMGEMVLEGARTTFAWMEGDAFLVQHTQEQAAADEPAVPPLPPEWAANSPMPVTTIMGLDDANEQFVQLYADARRVYRVYQMRLDDGVWELWREAPAFHQRFKGVFSEDGNTITAYWEFSSDGVNWEHDFDLTYTRVDMREARTGGIE